MKPESMKRLARLISMTQLLKRRPFKTKELQELYSLSERQVYRDLRLLQDAGIPVYNDKGHKVD